MKLSKLSLAIAAALAGQAAFAITASNYTNTGEFTGDTLNIRISGASAQDNGILGSALSLCTAGSLHKYSISNNAVYFCTPDVGTNPGQITVPSGITKLAIYKYSSGGSYYGVGPVNSNTLATGAALTATGNQLPFLDLTKINSLCTGTNATVTSAATFGSTTLGTYVNVACGTGTLTTAATTYIGLSDVEPAFFTTATGNLSSENIYGLIFGPIVSKNLYDALQTAQGLTVGSDTEANMPSLSSAQITAAFTQSGQTWGGIGVTSGLSDDSIYVARRVDSSGTQKVFEAVVVGTPNGQAGLKSCFGSSVLSFLAPDSGSTGLNTGDASSACNLTSGAPFVYGGSGGSNVRDCLANHSGKGRGAIGILTAEDKFGSANWRFVKVDGVAPTQANAAKGTYRHVVESFINTRASGTYATSSALGYTAVVNRLKADFSNPTIIKLINGADQTFGASGLMALNARQTAGTALDFTGASSVLPFTRVDNTGGANNCQRAVPNF